MKAAPCGVQDAAQSELRPLQPAAAQTTIGRLPAVLSISTNRTMMDGNICNIQVLLRAAEFLERRERGKRFVINCQCQWERERERKLVIVETKHYIMKVPFAQMQYSAECNANGG